MKMTVTNGKATIVFALNDSPTARTLAAQLLLTLDVRPFSTNEQAFYPPTTLETAESPDITSAQAGTLAYYAPGGRGDVLRRLQRRLHQEGRPVQPDRSHPEGQRQGGLCDPRRHAKSQDA